MFPILNLTGTPFERGQKYGQQVAPLVRHSIASYARMFAYYQGRDWPTAQQEAARFLPLLEDLVPDLVEEMCGIAAGSGRLLEEMVALNVRTELLAGAFANGRHAHYMQAMARNREFNVPQHSNEPQAELAVAGDMSECTTVAATPMASANGHTWLAQNWDWSGDQRAACVLLRVVQPGKPTLLTLTEAGIVAKIGLNSAGIAVTLNILAAQLDGKAPGMPVHVLLRKLLEQTSLDDAVALAKRDRSGASSCVTVVDTQGRAVSLEITPSGVGELHPVDGLLVHTNHCVCAVTQPNASPLAATSSSKPRYARAGELMRQAHGRVDRESIIAILTDETDAPMAICRHPDLSLHPCDRTESVAGIIIDTSSGVMHVASDVPSLTEFVPITVEA